MKIFYGWVVGGAKRPLVAELAIRSVAVSLCWSTRSLESIYALALTFRAPSQDLAALPSPSAAH